MRWSFRIGSIAGIAIRIHFTFLFLLAFLFWVNGMAGGWQAGVRSLVLLGTVFFCVLLHELGHSLVTIRYGYTVRSITLLPIGGLALLDEIPSEPRKEIAIALAGPAVNLVLAILFGGAVLLTDPGALVWPRIAGDALLSSVFWANVYIGLFNMIPAYPLDGGRVLRAIMVKRMSFIEATRHAVTVGQLVSVAFMLFGLATRHPWIVVVGLFVFWAGMAEERLAILQSAMEQIYLEDIMLTEYQSLRPDDSLFEAIERAVHSLQDDFPVVAEGKVVGVLSRAAMLGAFGGSHWQDSVQAVMSTRFEIAAPRDTLGRAFRGLSHRKVALVPVMDGGRLVGIVTLQNLMHSIRLLSRKGADELRTLKRG